MCCWCCVLWQNPTTFWILLDVLVHSDVSAPASSAIIICYSNSFCGSMNSEWFPRWKGLTLSKNVASFKLKAPNVVDLWGSGDFPPRRFALALFYILVSSCGISRQEEVNFLLTLWTRLFQDFALQGQMESVNFSSAMCCRSNFFDSHGTKNLTTPCVPKINLLGKLLPAQSTRLVFVNSERKSAPLCCFSF